MRPVGCDACRHLGYRGRMEFLKIFLVDDEVRYWSMKKLDAAVAEARPAKLGMRTLREDGVRKVLSRHDFCGGGYLDDKWEMRINPNRQES